jgi:predicted lipoprotein with Yx(FWY)xxD motif
MNVARPKLISALAATVLIASASFAVAASAQTVHTPTAAHKLVNVISGHVIVNSKGFTLYVFGSDAPGKSNCTGTCAKFWPPATVPTGLTPKKHVKGATGTFGVITRADGTRQLTYDSAPVYTFLQDKKAGDLNGEGLYASGGFWFPIVANRK